MLQFAPSTHYDNKSQPPSRRKMSDAELQQEIMGIWKDNFEACGAEKIWWQLHRGRDRVWPGPGARLMRLWANGG